MSGKPCGNCVKFSGKLCEICLRFTGMSHTFSQKCEIPWEYNHVSENPVKRAPHFHLVFHSIACEIPCEKYVKGMYEKQRENPIECVKDLEKQG